MLQRCALKLWKTQTMVCELQCQSFWGRSWLQHWYQNKQQVRALLDSMSTLADLVEPSVVPGYMTVLSEILDRFVFGRQFWVNKSGFKTIACVGWNFQNKLFLFFLKSDAAKCEESHTWGGLGAHGHRISARGIWFPEEWWRDVKSRRICQ